MSTVTFPASGTCACCGTVVVGSWDFGIYEPPTGTARYLYLLCTSCAEVAHGPDCDEVLQAVEQRAHFGPGGRA